MTDLFATVGAIYDDGIGLIFDGQAGISKKHYKCNSTSVFVVGQRVKLVKVSGTYLVEYPIGATGNGADAGTAGAVQAAEEAKKSAEAAASSAADAEASAQRIETMVVTGELYDPVDNPSGLPVYDAIPVEKTVSADGTITLYFRVPMGLQGPRGYQGPQGPSGEITNLQDAVDAVLAALPTWDGGSY